MEGEEVVSSVTDEREPCTTSGEVTCAILWRVMSLSILNGMKVAREAIHLSSGRISLGEGMARSQTYRNDHTSLAFRWLI